jgi:hypothetical protein
MIKGVILNKVRLPWTKTRLPRIKSGRVFIKRWAMLPWRKGANKIPERPETLLGKMPNRKRACPVTRLRISTIQSSRTNQTMGAHGALFLTMVPSLFYETVVEASQSALFYLGLWP